MTFRSEKAYSDMVSMILKKKTDAFRRTLEKIANGEINAISIYEAGIDSEDRLRLIQKIAQSVIEEKRVREFIFECFYQNVMQGKDRRYSLLKYVPFVNEKKKIGRYGNIKYYETFFDTVLMLQNSNRRLNKKKGQNTLLLTLFFLNEMAVLAEYEMAKYEREMRAI